MGTLLKVWMSVSVNLDNICRKRNHVPYIPLSVYILAEHDIFGEPVSDSEDDDEEANINVMELDENSRLSADSRVSDSNSMQAAYSERSSNNATTSSGLVTEFSKDMFHTDNNGDTETEKQQDEPTPSKVPKLEQFHSEYIIPDSPTSVSVSKGNFKSSVVKISIVPYMIQVFNLCLLKNVQIRVLLLFTQNWQNYGKEGSNRRSK